MHERVFDQIAQRICDCRRFPMTLTG
jgi:hypothetical protein